MKISSTQLAMLMMGFIFGTATIKTVAFAAKQDAWIAYSIGWALGFILIGLYAYIAILNPSKTLVDILREQLGKYLGSIVSLFYIFYFVFDAAIVTRNFSEFLIVTVYPETPIFFVTMVFLLVVVYLLKKGIEILGRASELFIPLTFAMILLVNIIFFNRFNLENIFPVLEEGIKPVLKVAYEQLTFPFGQVVAFLMVYPSLNNKKDIFKVSFLSTLVAGFMMFNMVLRDLLVLGAGITALYYYPFLASIKLVSTLLQPFPSLVLIAGILIKIAIFVYATALGIAQFFNLDNYKILIFPISIFVLALSIWGFDSHLEFLGWGSKIWPIYVIPFHFVFPLLLAASSWLRNKRKNI